MNTPENITKRSDLPKNAIFVFGSNLAGNHAGGAARVALEHFGAVQGKGKGLCGRSYAFPTLDQNLQKLTLRELEKNRDAFYLEAINLSGLTFILTKVGTGIAGYSEKEMKSFFKVKLSNVIYPKNW